MGATTIVIAPRHVKFLHFFQKSLATPLRGLYYFM